MPNKTRPILFSGEMVRAILEGRKTQTRREIKPQPSCIRLTDAGERVPMGLPPQHGFAMACPYGKPGDRLWVRETLRFDPDYGWRYQAGPEPRPLSAQRLDEIHGQLARMGFSYSRPSCPSIHMPRAASRITLEIVAVRVERLHEISDSDCYAEGITDEDIGMGLSNAAYLALWEKINGRASVERNPWVWVIEFKRAVEE